MTGKSSSVNQLNVDEVALGRLGSILKQWLPGGEIQGDEYVALNPTRNDKRPGSFKINLATGLWADFATDDKGGGAVSLAVYLFDLSQPEAESRLIKMLEASDAA